MSYPIINVYEAIHMLYPIINMYKVINPFTAVYKCTLYAGGK